MMKGMKFCAVCREVKTELGRGSGKEDGIEVFVDFVEEEAREVRRKGRRKVSEADMEVDSEGQKTAEHPGISTLTSTLNAIQHELTLSNSTNADLVASNAILTSELTRLADIEAQYRACQKNVASHRLKIQELERAEEKSKAKAERLQHVVDDVKSGRVVSEMRIRELEGEIEVSRKREKLMKRKMREIGKVHRATSARNVEDGEGEESLIIQG